MENSKKQNILGVTIDINWILKALFKIPYFPQLYDTVLNETILYKLHYIIHCKALVQSYIGKEVNNNTNLWSIINGRTN